MRSFRVFIVCFVVGCLGFFFNLNLHARSLFHTHDQGLVIWASTNENLKTIWQHHLWLSVETSKGFGFFFLRKRNLLNFKKKKKRLFVSAVLVQFGCLVGFLLRVCNLMVSCCIFNFFFFTLLPLPHPHLTPHTLPLGCIWLITWFVVERLLSKVVPCWSFAEYTT